MVFAKSDVISIAIPVMFSRGKPAIETCSLSVFLYISIVTGIFARQLAVNDLVFCEEQISDASSAITVSIIYPVRLNCDLLSPKLSSTGILNSPSF